MSNEAKLEAVLIRLYRARKARRDANEAFAVYLDQFWPRNCDNSPWHPEDGASSSERHRYACCGLGQTGSMWDPEPILCDICKGSHPFYVALQVASREAGNALRQAQAIGKRLALRSLTAVSQQSAGCAQQMVGKQANTTDETHALDNV